MLDFDPKEMDALFREGAERHEFEYNADSWAMMEEMLDEKAKKRRGFLFILGVLIVLALGTLFMFLGGNESVDNNEKVEVATSQEIEKTNTTFVLDQSKKKSINVEESTVPVTPTKPIKEYISSDSKESRSNIGAQNSFQSENTGNLVGNEVVSIPSQGIENDIEESEPSEAQEPFVNTQESDTRNNNIVGIIEQVENEQLIIPFLNGMEIKEIENQRGKLDSEDLVILPVDNPKVLLENRNRFALTLFANPEWSSVGLLNDPKVGWSIGTRVGYQFANKFEISAGVAYSRKIYRGGGKAYTMEGGWYVDIEPMRMDAKCDVIEIPIGMSYYINGFRNNGMFVDLGVNSYMMHSEWYGFNYDDALIRPERYEEVNEEAANSHLIGVGRIAVGYQKILSNKTSFQVAPYLQFPLTGIGAGQVSVYSTGVQLAVKFNTQ